MLVALWIGKTPTLVTSGDAVAGYLDRPDELANHLCLSSKRDVIAGRISKRPDHQTSGHLYHNVRQRWLTTVGLRRWLSRLSLCILALVTGLSVLGIPALLAHVLLANLPQAIVSFPYFLYNGVLTSMLLAHEWSAYAVHRKGLRVTVERGAQRSTYWLQLPYEYGVSLITAMTVLHTLISQAISLNKIDLGREGYKYPERSLVAAGLSSAAILACIVIGSIMLLVLLGLGFRKFPSAMPVAGYCSFAIAAACHPPVDDVDAAFLPVQWGAVKIGDKDGQCSFTSQEVSELIPGRRYAGWSGGEDGTRGARRRR
ncbi:hypothetical protein MBLNU230_g1516t1 [Neophaeotheca triangularis]